MSIDKNSLAFVIPIKENGKSWTLYIPAPSKDRVEFAAPILGGLFSIKEKSGLSLLVLARDYEIYARRACKQIIYDDNKNPRDLENEENELFNNFKNFIEASLLAGTAITPDFKNIKIIEIKDKLSESTLEYAIGFYVFFYVTYRYAWIILTEKEKKAISTSLNLMEYINYLQTSLSKKESFVEKVEP